MEQLTIEEASSLPLFRNILCGDELLELSRSFSDVYIVKYEQELGADNFGHWYRVLVEKKNRRGEISFAIVNDYNQYLVHTKSFYPHGIYRIPTGGVKMDEPILDAYRRELREETGFSVPAQKIIAVVLYIFAHNGQKLPFASYLFKSHANQKEPMPQDTDEDISGFKWVDLDGIAQIVDQLKNMEKGWQDWGFMRSIPHELLLLSERG